MTEHVKGYKATLWNGMPKYGRRRTPYKPGKVYKTTMALEPCHGGLHFCDRLCNVYGTYNTAFYTRIFRVEAQGRVVRARSVREGSDKACTDKLRVAYELTPVAVLQQLAHEANYTELARYAACRASQLLFTVLHHQWEIRDFTTCIVENRPEWHGMSWRQFHERKLAWASAFLELAELPLCRLVMQQCTVDGKALKELSYAIEKELKHEN